MIRGVVPRHSPAQEVQQWKQRCQREEAVDNQQQQQQQQRQEKEQQRRQHRRRRCRHEAEHLLPPLPGVVGDARHGDGASVASAGSLTSRSTCSHSSFGSLASSRSRRSLASFCTEDSGFTFAAQQRFEQFERALEEEKRKREQAEAKLDRVMRLLERRHQK